MSRGSQVLVVVLLLAVVVTGGLLGARQRAAPGAPAPAPGLGGSAPGELEMRQLVEEGFVDAATVTDFGTLDLVVIAHTKTKGLDSIQGLTSPRIKTISLADPQYNSIGYYGEAALKSMGLWESLQAKLLLREDPLEGAALATNGQVDAGITFLTCPLDTNPEKADA